MQTNDSTTAVSLHSSGGSMLQAFSDPTNAPGRHNLPTTVPSLIDAALAAFDADRDTSRRYLLRASALLAANRVSSGAESARRLESRGGLLAWQLNRVIDYIEAQLAEKITAIDLADLIQMSTGQLFRAFKISVGMTPFRYIARRRIELACTMMRATREPLSQVAIACGMCDQPCMCKMFRRLLGMTPSEWRREHQVAPRYRAHCAAGCRIVPPGSGGGVDR
jgi:AraC family transcriptional regulator